MIEGARPEVELVCRCIVPSVDAAGRERIDALLAHDLDWEFLLEFARRHEVVPVLHRRLVGEYGHRLSEEVRSTLDARQRSQTVRNLQMAAELHELLDRFEAEGVRALPVKGPVLAESTHRSLSHRTFYDLDILLHEADISRGLDAMESMGYRRTIDAPRLDDAAILGGPLTPALANEYSLQHPERDTIVEVGWQIGSDPFSLKLGFETVWNRRVSTAVAGRAVPALAPDDRILLLTYHCVKHGCALLKWVSDIAEAIHANPSLNWRALFRRAQECGTARRLTVGLGVTVRLLDVDVPPLREWLQTDDVAAKLVDQVHDRFVTQPLSGFELIDTMHFHLAASDSRRARALSRLFTTSAHPTLAEYRLLPLPGPLHPVYYLLRPLRLFVVYGVLGESRPEPTQAKTVQR